jgi:diguanylate cyclase (GGDEF)-like protein
MGPMGDPNDLSVLSAPARLAALAESGLMDSLPEAAFDRLTRLVARLLRVPTALVSLVDDKRQFFKSAVGFTAEPWASQRGTPLSHSFCKHAIAQAGPLVIDDARAHPLVKHNPAIHDLGVVAYAGVPLVLPDGHALGVLCAIDGQPRTWSDEDLETLGDLADAAVVEVRLRLAQAEAATQARTLEAVLNGMEEYVVLMRPDGSTQAMNESAVRVQHLAADVPVEERPLGRALRGEEVRQVELEVRPPDGEARWHSINANPIRDAAGAIVGAVAVGRDVTELKQLHDRLESLSLTDDLTGLYNRRGFVRLGAPQLRLAERKHRPLMLFFADVDGLKAINDKLGHEVGDDAIVQAARLLERVFRTSDVVARLGGDEFVALAMEADSAKPVVARMDAALYAFNAEGARPYQLAISIGAVRYEQGSGESLDGMLARADAVMYAAKRARRAGASRTP